VRSAPVEVISSARPPTLSADLSLSPDRTTTANPVSNYDIPSDILSSLGMISLNLVECL
jgi:hypothetical protein